VRLQATPTRRQLLATTPGTLYLASWLLHRLVIGVLGVAMPLVLIVGERILFPGGAVDFPRSSLSAYYYSGLRDWFVATLAATGVFLFTYMALHRNADNAVSSLAGLGALGVAFCPTGPEHGEVAPPWARLIGVHTCQVVHSTCAVVFIAALAVMSVRFARREGARQNRGLALLHVACALVMAVTAVAALVLGAVGVQRVGSFSGLLVVELVCTYAFGVSWLVKGLELRRALT
jgi:hypothetical protein